MAAKIHFRDPFEHEPAPPPAETDKTIRDDSDKGTEDEDKEKIKEALDAAYSASRQPPTAAQHQAILSTTLSSSNRTSVIKEENGKEEEDKDMKKFLKEGQRKRRLLDWNGHWHPRAVWIIEDRLQKTPSSSAILSPEFKAHLAMELESPPVESMIRCVIPHECTESLEIMADPLKKVPDLRVMEFKKTQFGIDPLIQMGRKAPAGKAEIWKPEPVAFRGASTSYWIDDEMPRPLMGVRPPDDPKFKDKPSFFANLRRQVKEEQEAKKRKKEEEEEEEEEKEKASKKEQAAKEKEEKETKAKAKRVRVQSEVYVKEEEVSENSGKLTTKWVRVKSEGYVEAEEEEEEEDGKMYSSAANRSTRRRQNLRDRSGYPRRRRRRQQQKQHNCNNN